MSDVNWTNLSPNLRLKVVFSGITVKIHITRNKKGLLNY